MAEKTYPITATTFDGAKFAQRYSLTPTQFRVELRPAGLTLILQDGLTLPQDPPIFDLPDTPAEATHKRLIAYLQQPGEDAVFTRALLLTLLDAINTLRAAVIPPLATVTRAQLLNALTQKINSGQADN